MIRRTLVVRSDAVGDVLLAGPAVRAVARSASHVVMLAGPRGREAASLLPGIDELVTWAAPWIEPRGAAVDPAGVDELVRRLRTLRLDEAVVLTSYHQSSLPMALLLRMAGIERIVACSEDFPGSLLDVRVPDPGDVPEPVRALHIAAAAGHTLPEGDDGLLRIRPVRPWSPDRSGRPFLVLHPGTSVPARGWHADGWRSAAAALARDGWRIVVTGGPDERELTTSVVRAAGPGARDLAGSTSLGELAEVLAGAHVLVAANTGPAHLAAAVGTPVVSLFAPTVPAARWAPYGVPTRILGNQGAACRGTRATTCPVPGHPCLGVVTAEDVVDAVRELSLEVAA